MNGLLLVTGASRGIGAATALLAAARGYAVAVNYVNDAGAAQGVCAQIIDGGGRAFALQADVAREGEVLTMFAAIDACGIPLTALVNNAGVVGQVSRFTDYTLARLQRSFAVNVLGAFLVAREALKRMATTCGGQGGAIVNVSSAAARLGSPHEFIDYAASKGAIDTFTLGLAKEFGGQGVRVNAVRPGIIATEIHASAGAPDRVARFAPQVPLARAGTAAEVAQTILWLLSDEAAYLTGALVDVAGGR